MIEHFMTVWNSPNRYPLMAVCAIAAMYIPIALGLTRRNRRSARVFLAAHPDAASVYCRLNSISSGQINVLSVNGAKPAIFSGGIKPGFYLAPGESTIQFTFNWTSTGLMRKSRTTIVGPINVRVNAQASKTYTIAYDKAAEKCVFEEEQAS